MSNFVPVSRNILIIDRHERKRFQIGAALDQAGHKVIDFAPSRSVAYAIFECLQPSDVDVVLLGDIVSGETRKLAQAELLREISKREIGKAVVGISYNARPVSGVTNFPLLHPEDNQDLMSYISTLPPVTARQA